MSLPEVAAFLRSFLSELENLLEMVALAALPFCLSKKLWMGPILRVPALLRTGLVNVLVFFVLGFAVEPSLDFVFGTEVVLCMGV